VVEDVVEIVVDDVEKGVAGNLRSAAGNVVHVVAFEGNQLEHVSKFSVRSMSLLLTSLFPRKRMAQ
jgi:hypothetical protein